VEMEQDQWVRVPEPVEVSGEAVAVVAAVAALAQALAETASARSAVKKSPTNWEYLVTSKNVPGAELP